VPGLCRYENDIGCSYWGYGGRAVTDANEPFAADIREPLTARDAPILPALVSLPSEPMFTVIKILLEFDDGVIETLNPVTVTYEFVATE
tara:strand:- start:41 stop:307 length:267 start_codon:yes stop_codon:yes gene_type:complete